MSETPHPVDESLHLKVQSAITSALKEEKQSVKHRWLRVLLATSVTSLLFAFPFFLLFKNQMNETWGFALAGWFIYFVLGYYFFFKPQTRLLISGVWSPHVIARIFLVSTFATILQVMICPSFVFLESSADWNPLLPMTSKLMQLGGMALCMGFCGFLFSLIAGGLGFWSILPVARARGFKSSAYLFSILTLSQLPIIFVQIGNPELRPYALDWVFGIILGFAMIKLIQVLSLLQTAP